MRNYVLQRVALSVPTIVGLTVFVFLLLHLAIRTDTVELLLAQYGTSDPQLADKIREEFGLDSSLPEQYLRWVGNIAQGDLGSSFFTKRTVTSELANRLPTSIEVGVGALILTMLIAIPIGVISAVRQDSLTDYGLRGSAILIDAIPGFWTATLVLVFGSVWFGWAPPLQFKPLWEDPVANIKIVILPMILLGLQPIGSMIRLTRTQVLEIVRQDYVRTARSKGLGTRAIYTRHVMRNALLPIVTVVGLQLPRLVAGTVIFEQIFGLPGVGRYLIDAIGRLDYPVIQAVNLVFGLTLVLSNLIVDVSYGWIDPRIRLR